MSTRNTNPASQQTRSAQPTWGKTRQYLLKSSVAVMTLAVVNGTCYAQGTTTANPGAAVAPAGPQDSPAPNNAADIIVTGSRIIRDGYKAPTPMSVIGAAQLATSANSNLAQYVVNLPQFAGSQSSQSNTSTGASGAAGINQLNLRALGANRTLVLLDGRRVAPALPTGIVDANSIPQALISRVDVVTGGASATYGSDAVGGVVNFVLDKKLTGLRGEVSGGATNYSDGKNYKISLAGGLKFAGDRGHILIAGEQVHDDGVRGGTRAWTRVGLQNIVNPNYTATNGQPQRLIVPSVGYLTAAPGGVIASGPLQGTAFGLGGRTYQQQQGSILADPFMQGGAWQQNDIRPFNDIAPSENRQLAFGRVSFEVSDALQLYGQASYIRARTHTVDTSVFMVGSAGPLITLDNAFLPADVRSRMVTAGLSSIRVGTLNQDLGITTQDTDRRSFVYTLGGNGKFDALGTNWRWDAYFQHADNQNNISFPNNISRANYALATDAVVSPTTGSIVCRSTLSSPGNGCSPYNAMGVGVNDPNGAAISYIRSPSWQRLNLRQTVIGASITGEPVSTWAGPVSVAVAAEYRKDSANAIVDPGSLVLDHIYANFSPIAASTDVKEISAETLVPLAKNKSWADSWNLNGAIRFTSYQYAGNVATWKIGTTYSPVPDITFRFTRSRDIRAPSLQEAFLPANTARNTVFDPFTNTSPFFNQTTVGNPNLKPEKADTLGIGVVFTPQFLHGFSASVDYWDINIKDAISSVAASDVLGLCYTNAAPALCANIRRSNGVLTDVITQNINFAQQHVRGVDVEASYRFDLENAVKGLPGSLYLHANFTRYLQDLVDSKVAPARDLVGENSGANPPTWRTTASVEYKLNGLTTSLTGRAFSSGTQFAYYIQCTSSCPASTAVNPTVNNNYMPGRLYLDLSVMYDFNIGGSRTASIFFNVRNLTDRDPAPSAAGNAFSNGSNSVLYDVMGRVFRGGVRFKI